MQTQIYPWQSRQWEQLNQAQHENRLPHGLLFVGAQGLGKHHFAKILAHRILCQHPTPASEACNTCHSCHLFNAQSHPDFMQIEPEEAGKAIGIEPVRNAVKFVNETTMQGGYRVILINPATAMNTNAANALLKTLEEPTPNTVIILISDQSLRLPATIKSRCQKIIFTKPSDAEALAWLQNTITDKKADLKLLLKLANGAPLQAQALIDTGLLTLRSDLYQDLQLLNQNQANPLGLAAKWQDTPQLSLIDLFISWLNDLLRFQITQDPTHLINTDYESQIAQASKGFEKNKLLAFLDYLQQTRATLLTAINLNKQLMLEDILIRWNLYVSR